MVQDVEIELKFLVPSKARAAVAAEVGRETASSGRMRLLAMYLDTPDRRLARAGLAWRLRREGRRWVQTLKAPGAGPLERFEHEVLRPGPEPDAALHAGTAAGERLVELLRRARKDGNPVGVRYRTEVRRMIRRVRTRGAVVELAFDEGRIVAAAPGTRGPTVPLCELEFELVSGNTVAMIGLAQRWCGRFGLVVDPRSKAERGDRLADGQRFPALRKGEEIDYPRDADAVLAFGAVLDECREQILRNAIGLAAGDPSLRVDHVHQLRVGIRRMRSALRAFRGFVAPPPDALVEGLRGLFEQLGRARDQDVLASGVATALVRAGAPALTAAPRSAADTVDVVAVLCAAQTQKLLLEWIAWGAMPAVREGDGLQPVDADAAPVAASSGLAEAAGIANAEPFMAAVDAGWAAGTAQGEDREPAGLDGAGRSEKRGEKERERACEGASAGQEEQGVPEDGGDAGRDFARRAARRLRRWHRGIALEVAAFDSLDNAGLHELRKRIKRQRYAVEFFAPVLRGSRTAAYLKRLRPAQERMGELNDLFVARARYESMGRDEPGVWFAQGWLAARIADVLALARVDLERLARCDPPAA